VVQYYLLAHNVHWLSKLHWVSEVSLLKTLAGKHKSSVAAMARKYKATTETANGPGKCLQVVIREQRRSPSSHASEASPSNENKRQSLPISNPNSL